MLAKLALRNVRRSARDYAIYFVTVALGVSLFYAFNTVNDQAVLFDALSSDSLRMLGVLTYMMGLLSVVVACVLGFLVVYANRFLIRRRRHEFGMYLMLGMSAGRVSRILLYETAIVGLASLACGLGLGIALSQGLSFATAALMGTTMTKYQFIVSGGSVLFTVLCFAGIFAVSALVDIVYVRRCKLAALLSTHAANEKGVKASLPVRVAVFVVSLGVLACAYWQLMQNGLVEIDNQFWLATALMICGTALFFWSVSGFVVAFLQRVPGVYFCGLTSFTVRQISSKINTAFASMSVVCVMLFFSLTISSVGLGLVDVFAGNLDEISRYDMTVQASPYYAMEAMFVDGAGSDAAGGNAGGEGAAGDAAGDDAGGDGGPFGESAQLYKRYGGDMVACLVGEAAGGTAGSAVGGTDAGGAAGAPEAGAGASDTGADAAGAGASNADAAVDSSVLSWDSFVKASAQVDYYRLDGVTYADILSQVPDAYDSLSDAAKASAESIATVMSVGQYNVLCALSGVRGIMLEQGQCAVNNLFQGTEGAANVLCREKAALQVGDTQLHFSGKVQHVPVRNSATVDVVLEIIVPDSVIDGLKAAGQVPSSSVLDIMYKTDRAQGDVAFNKLMHQAFPISRYAEDGVVYSFGGEVPENQTFASGAWPCMQNYSGREMADQATGMRMVITYLAVYIGFVLLVATAAILAIQQLSETADSLGRYRRLRDLGASERSVMGSLRVQTVVYFAAPLLLAVCHTACAVGVTSGTLFSELGVSILDSVLVSGAVVLAVYGGYLLVTYLLSRSIMRGEL